MSFSPFVRMSFEMKCELIAGVEEEECLWNPRCANYHKGDKRNEAWAKIQRGLQAKGHNCDLLMLKMYWKNLRDHWRKRLNMPTGSAAQKPWAFSDRMSFLLEGEARGVRFSNLSMAPAPAPASAPVPAPRVPSPDYEFYGPSVSYEGLDEETSRETDTPVTLRRKLGAPSSQEMPPAKRRRGELIERSVVCIEETAQLLRNQFSRPDERPQDKYQALGDTVARFPRDMPPRKAQAKCARIAAILFEPDDEED